MVDVGHEGLINLAESTCDDCLPSSFEEEEEEGCWCFECFLDRLFVGDLDQIQDRVLFLQRVVYLIYQEDEVEYVTSRIINEFISQPTEKFNIMSQSKGLMDEFNNLKESLDFWKKKKEKEIRMKC